MKMLAHYDDSEQRMEPLIPADINRDIATHPIYEKKSKFAEEISSNSYFSLVYKDIKDLFKGNLKDFKTFAKFLYNNSSFARHIIENPGGEQALHDIYTYIPENKDYTWIDRILLSLPACEATRKRRKAYKSLLSESIKELYNETDSLYIADLGSGRGLIPLEVAHEFISGNGKRRNINLTLVDKDARALTIARSAAKSYGLDENTFTVNDNVKRFVKAVPHKYHLIGTHGLLDYFSDSDATEFFNNIADALMPSGYLITTNMTLHNDKISKILMEKAGNWRLVYRTPEELESLIEQTGKYDIEDIVITDDSGIYRTSPAEAYPDGFHVLIRARKKDNLFTLFF